MSPATLKKRQIKGIFDKETLLEKGTVYPKKYKNKSSYIINPHEGFEIVELPDGTKSKLAYGNFYSPHTTDFDIELIEIKYWEAKYKSSTGDDKKEAYDKLKLHYKKCISLIPFDHDSQTTTTWGSGWNRWSEDILDMFLSDKLTKVLWGSGNCGKSAIMALLFYIKWRVNPPGRMIVIASKVVKDASARVFGYIKKIHDTAPKSSKYEIEMKDNNKEKALYHIMIHPETGKKMKNDRGCIISLPVKVNAKQSEEGSNLLGKHPDDWLGIGFDECQELVARSMEKIFANWLTNDNLDVFAWGNPQKVDYYNKEDYDLLFKLGIKGLSKQQLIKLRNKKDQTFVNTTKKTYLLHLTMMDSPKDDPEEISNYIKQPNGTKKLRLHFIAGKNNIEQIKENTTPNSPAWYAQVLGFPYVDFTGESTRGIITAPMVKKSKEMPLKWYTPEHQLQWFMGVDPSVSGYGDDCSIVIGKMGVMMDGRQGIDFMGGKHCTRVKPIANEDFIDTSVNKIYMLSQQHNIPLKNIAIETFSAGEVIRYAMQKNIEEGKWKNDVSKGETFEIIQPVGTVTDRHLFMYLGKMKPSKEFLMDKPTEYWWAVRCGIYNRQIFNVPEYILEQFYNRFIVSNESGHKQRIENKTELKKRGVKSPNDADALCNVIECCRRNGFEYKFYNKDGYYKKYGSHDIYFKEQETIKKRMSIVQNMLQINNNFYGLNNNKKGKKKGRGQMDSI